MNQKKPMIGDQLALLATRQKVHVKDLFQSLVLARKNDKSTCMELTVQYRCTVKNKAVFLITRNSKVIAQFGIAEDFLLKKDINFEMLMNTKRIRQQMLKQNLDTRLSKTVQDLRHGMKRINVEAEVLENPKSSPIYTRYGNSAMVISAWIADETGKVKLCLWTNQAYSFAKGDTIQIKNASVSTFRGEMQLFLGKRGTISVLH